MTHTKFKVGSHIIYNDGRNGHIGVRAVVLEVTDKGMKVQFEDRAATTQILFSEKSWMNFITTDINPNNN